MILVMGEPKTIGELLKQIHLERSRIAGHVISQKELAQWFGIEPVIFNKYYNDLRVPEGENLEKIAGKAGPIAYQLAGQIPADIENQVKSVPPDRLDELMEYIAKFLRDNGWTRSK